MAMANMSNNRVLCLCPRFLFCSKKLEQSKCSRGAVLEQATRSISCGKYPLFYKTGYGTGPVARVQACLDGDLDEQLKTSKFKPKEHPGIFHLPKVGLPEKFSDAVQKIVSHENVKEIVESGKYLRNYIWSRRLPMEEEWYKQKVMKIEDEIQMKDEALLPFLSQQETVKLKKKQDNEILKRLRLSCYHWEPIRFSKEKALEYLFARSAGEYATLCRVFNEIAKRDSEFQPKTLCDFGSGVGTVSWAARAFWKESLVEHLCADVSWEMNELAELILRGGCQNNDHPIPALFFRHHLPESYKIGYDLVVSAFSLMELPSARERLQTIDKLWNKTHQYLVILEPGTRAGFRAVIEARDYILGLGSSSRRGRNCFVFSPCPNNMECPRFAFDTVPCNFEVKYRPLYPFHTDGCTTDRFCYIVMRRGNPDPNDPQWPRLIQEPMIRPRHVICRVCTKDAKISEVVLTKAKHSQSLRLVAKRSDWGDLLPIQTEDLPPAESTETTEKDIEFD